MDSGAFARLRKIEDEGLELHVHDWYSQGWGSVLPE
jgi:hypothetical protein